MTMNFETTNTRMSISFAFVILLYAIGFWYLKVSSVSMSRTIKIITSVELLKFEKPAPVALKAPEPAKIAVQEPEKPAQAPVERKVKLLEPQEIKTEVIKKAVPRPTFGAPPALEENKEPVRRLPAVQIEELKRERDAKINDLIDMTKSKGAGHAQKLITQEQGLTERKMPLPAPSMAKTAVLEEVGASRVAPSKITDVARQAAAVKKTVELNAPGDASPLVEKKRILKMQLAALSAQTNALPDAQQEPRRGKITDITGTLKERQKAQEVAQIQKIIDAQDDPAAAKRARPANSSFGAPPETPAPEKLLSSVKDLPAKTRAPEITIKRTMITEEKDTIREAKKSAPEISGPLKQRKLISSNAPAYPEWAKRQGIEADVVLKFYVDPRGYVMGNITVERTSGYRELDMLSIEALKKWIFEPLGKNEPQQDQWGGVTMRYVLE